MAGDYFMYSPMGTSNNYNYTITYQPIVPRHPGCPGRKHTCPDCGQEYFAPTPVQPIWVVPMYPNWYNPYQPSWIYCSGATGDSAFNGTGISSTATYGTISTVSNT